MSKFLTVFCGLLLFASPLYAQDNKVYIGENDTIRYSYTPLQTDSIPASQPSDTLAAAPKKKSFWRRLIDYFGESSTDKNFRKKDRLHLHRRAELFERHSIQPRGYGCRSLPP